MPKLKITLPDSGEVVHELVDENITLGRVDDNVIQIDDASVSSHHAQLQLVAGGNYHLTDLGSTNGTRVNGTVTTEAQLRHGDRVRFGKIEAAYLSDTIDASQPLPAAVEPEAQPAAESRRPTNFANASPFQKKAKERDPAGRVIMICAICAMVLLVVALVFVFLLQPPPPIAT
jgi:pSer/pThr/pTyr-binding forkhead associated (FHA) protein